MTNTLPTYQVQTLSDAPNPSLIQNENGSLRIVKRYPANGVPKKGIPFAIDVEVTMEKTFNNSVLGVGCTEMTVIAYDPQYRTILGSANIDPSLFSCTGTGKLIFSEKFVPDKNHPVMFDVVWNNDFRKDISSLNKTWDTNPIMRSGVLTLDVDEKEGLATGLYAKPTEPWYNFEYTKTSALFGINTTLKRVITISAIGVGVYFAAPFFPVIKNGIKNIAAKK
ncbi:hypothetical protein [Gracilimonas tropica]|uniref:hypothetical protein n=1 Tax=Gracilimonas tropica TaxID=454600 RepID=UPI000374BCB4|nr:hypothetical protein [Gracilimonas tropica]